MLARRRGMGIRFVSALAAVLMVSLALAQEISFLRIGTGDTGGSYFPIGGVIANAISNPPGSLACDLGGSCGVPGLIATAVATKGSVSNAAAVSSGKLDLALIQADVAYNAYAGKGVFAGKAMPNLAAVANMFPETLHVVVRRDAALKTVTDFKGRRVSLGAEGSGSLTTARLVLAASGLDEGALHAVYEEVGPSADALEAGELDAFFVVGGAPISGVQHLAERVPIKLLSVMGPVASAIRKAHPVFGADVIPAETYPGVGAVVTVKVGAQLIVAADADADLVYGITRALWHPTTRTLLEKGPPNGRQMQLHRALDGIAIPLHPGAARYYREVGFNPSTTASSAPQ